MGEGVLALGGPVGAAGGLGPPAEGGHVPELRAEQLPAGDAQGLAERVKQRHLQADPCAPPVRGPRQVRRGQGEGAPMASLFITAGTASPSTIASCASVVRRWLSSPHPTSPLVRVALQRWRTRISRKLPGGRIRSWRSVSGRWTRILSTEATFISFCPLAGAWVAV